MAGALQKCPQCGRLMDAGRPACRDCEALSRPLILPASRPPMAPTSPPSPRPVQQAPETDTCAVLSLVCGLLCLFFLPPILGGAALVLGIIGLARILQGLSRKGLVFAVIGGVLGLVQVLGPLIQAAASWR